MRLLSIRTNLQRAAAALVLSAAPAALADGHMAENTAYDAAQLPDPVNFVTQHRGRFNGQNVDYRVEAGETYLRNEDGEPTAALFSFSYIKDDAGTDRPVTFIFNGGPGSASIWLHMGMFGPKRAVVASDADEDDGAAPYLMVDNPLSVLDVTDMVFIDPIGTGYSRPIGVGEGADFWSQEGDTASVADFIRIWVTKHKRWNAPKYIAGESFGTMRAAAVANELTNGTQNISLNGLMMISQALDYEGSTPVHDNFYSYVTYLPTLAAVARYHGKGPAEPADLDAYLEEVRDFAVNEYAPALLQGAMLAPAERARIRDKLATYTGLSPDYVETSNLRILTGRFNKELLRDQGLAVGGADGRYTVDDADDIAERPTINASSAGFRAAYSSVLHHYMTTALGVEMDRPYKMSNPQVGQSWSYLGTEDGRGWEPSYVNVSRKLSNAMRTNADLRVWVANGIYDLITPFFDAEMTFAGHDIPQDNLAFTYYPAGHMMYVHHPSFERIMADTRAFLANEMPMNGIRP